MVLGSYIIVCVDRANFLMWFLKLFKFDDLFYVQDGLSDVPSAPPIHDYDKDNHPVTHDDTRSSANANCADGLSAKKEEHQVNGAANLADKNDR